MTVRVFASGIDPHIEGRVDWRPVHHVEILWVFKSRQTDGALLENLGHETFLALTRAAEWTTEDYKAWL